MSLVRSTVATKLLWNWRSGSEDRSLATGKESTALPSLDPVAESDSMGFWERLWKAEAGQDVAEYAVMLAVILVIALATVRLIGTGAGASFSSIAQKIQ